MRAGVDPRCDCSRGGFGAGGALAVCGVPWNKSWGGGRVMLPRVYRRSSFWSEVTVMEAKGNRLIGGGDGDGVEEEVGVRDDLLIMLWVLQRAAFLASLLKV